MYPQRRFSARYHDPVLLVTITSSVLGAHCYVLAADGQSPCVIVDAGVGVAEPVRQAVGEYGLHPQAVLATHGHLDHIYDSAELCDGYGVPFLIAQADQYRLADPLAGLGPGFDVAFVSWVGPTFAWREPATIHALDAPSQTDSWTDRLGVDVPLGVRAAPGHTEGSVILRCSGEFDPRSVLPLNAPIPPGHAEVLFTGDVLFAGSIGRCDLPGGDASVMARTLTTVFGDVPGDAIVLPGHGPATTVAAQRRSNPYL